MAVTYRIMRTEDYAAVYALWMSCAGMGLNDVDDSPEGIAKFLARNPETCFVAEEEDRVVGVILTGNDGRRGYIYHTAVRPDCRHRGIASELANRSLAALKAMGISKVGLVAFRRNEAGNAFWEREGFVLRDDLYYRSKALVDMTRIDT